MRAKRSRTRRAIFSVSGEGAEIDAEFVVALVLRHPETPELGRLRDPDAAPVGRGVPQERTSNLAASGLRHGRVHPRPHVGGQLHGEPPARLGLGLGLRPAASHPRRHPLGSSGRRRPLGSRPPRKPPPRKQWAEAPFGENGRREPVLLPKDSLRGPAGAPTPLPARQRGVPAPTSHT